MAYIGKSKLDFTRSLAMDAAIAAACRDFGTEVLRFWDNPRVVNKPGMAFQM
jgi:hypothetical protein